jgi:hypothetical protein
MSITQTTLGAKSEGTVYEWSVTFVRIRKPAKQEAVFYA